MSLKKISPNRRRADRKPLERSVRYKTLNKKGEGTSGLGRTVNMSSSGVLLTTNEPLEVGGGVELAINWPADLEDGTKLKLVAWGTVVRNGEGKTAVKIQQYEFRTLGSQGI